MTQQVSKNVTKHAELILSLLGIVAAAVVYSLIALSYIYGTFLTKAEADVRAKFRDNERIELKESLKDLKDDLKAIGLKVDTLLTRKQ